MLFLSNAKNRKNTNDHYFSWAIKELSQLIFQLLGFHIGYRKKGAINLFCLNKANSQLVWRAFH